MTRDPGWTPTDEQLTKAAAHMSYELAMAAGCAHRLRFETLDDLGTNAYTEALLIHVRVCIEFFLEGGDEDHIRRADFKTHVKDGWRVGPPAAKRFLLSQRDAINAELAHPSWERVTKPKSSWDYIKLAGYTCDVGRSWFRHVDKQRPTLLTKEIEGNLNYSSRQMAQIIAAEELARQRAAQKKP